MTRLRGIPNVSDYRRLQPTGSRDINTAGIEAARAATGSTDEASLRDTTTSPNRTTPSEAEIEHRRELEKLLARRERELTDFVEHATVGLHRVGADGTILWANRADCEMLGYSLDEYIGHSITTFHEDREVIESMLERLAAGETLHNFPARLRSKDGSIKHVLINSSACIEDGRFLYTRCFTRDVTDLWQAEQALREADRRKNEFLATLAHELRNPLAPIRNALEMLRLAATDQELSTKARAIMERQVEHVVRLVDDLLDLSRLARDKLKLRKEQVELSAVVRAAIETTRPSIDAAAHELNVTLPSEAVYLHGDATRLAQVLANLLDNSAKYTPRGGRIDFEAQLDGDHVLLRVRDNGIGIPCDMLAYVFDMFRQADRSLEKSHGGLGIGLTLVRRLVELHGGTVSAQSEGMGKGSEFVVRLPAAGQKPTAAPPTVGSEKSATAHRILVVDDNYDSSATLATLLKLLGHEVCVAHDGIEAIEAGAALLPDMILMDVGMPRLNGYDATRRIRELAWGKDICIVALTGWGQDGDLQQSTAAGCSGHVVKPVDFATLERLIGSLQSRGG